MELFSCFPKYDIRESVTHFGCIRCGKCVNKYSKHPDRIWRHKCIAATRPAPRHGIYITNGGWRCRRCQRKGNRLFHTSFQPATAARNRITSKGPPLPEEPEYGNVRRRIGKKRPPRLGEPGYGARSGNRKTDSTTMPRGNGNLYGKGNGKQSKGRPLHGRKVTVKVKCTRETDLPLSMRPKAPG